MTIIMIISLSLSMCMCVYIYIYTYRCVINLILVISSSRIIIIIITLLLLLLLLIVAGQAGPRASSERAGRRRSRSESWICHVMWLLPTVFLIRRLYLNERIWATITWSESSQKSSHHMIVFSLPLEGTNGGPKERVSWVTTGSIMFCPQIFTCSYPHVNGCSNPLPWTDAQTPFLGTALVAPLKVESAQSGSRRYTRSWCSGACGFGSRVRGTRKTLRSWRGAPKRCSLTRGNSL